MNRKDFDLDVITLFLFLLMVIIGWATIYAVSSATQNPDFLDLNTIHGRQLVWIGISLLAGLVIITLDHKFIEAVSYLGYAVSILLLILVLFIGKEVNGARSWIIVGGQAIQPSEFAKFTTILALAKFMSAQNFSFSNNKHLFTAAAIVLIPALVIIAQNDTGTALVFGSLIIVFIREGLNAIVPVVILIGGIIFMSTLLVQSAWLVSGVGLGFILLSFWITYNKRYLGKSIMFHLLALSFLCLVSFSTKYTIESLPTHQQNRVKVLFNPKEDPLGMGYNVIQSQIAIGSGGLYGKGYRKGTYTKYRFVPKQETDFIFCTVGEEAGWMGTTLVLGLLFVFLLRIRFVAENSKTHFSRIYGYGLLAIIFCHTIINIGMTIGLVPVIGIPLPFFSYGGSNLISTTLMVFVMINLYSSRIAVLGSKV